jgi:PAS domain S-box-containing protein
MGPLFAAALSGEGVARRDQHMVVQCNGFPEDTWFDHHHSPIKAADGSTVGVFTVVNEVTDRVRAELALRASEEHLHNTVELNPQVAWTAGPDGRITSYSNRWLELTGQQPGEPLGDGWLNTVLEEDRPPTTAIFAQSLATGDPVDVEYRISLAGTGEPLWVRARAYPLRAEDGSVRRWYGVVEDINDRKLAELRLQESEERLRLATEHAEVGLWDVDEVNQRLLWPPLVKAMFGISPDKPVSMADFYAGIHSDDADEIAAAFAAAADPARRALYDVEYRTVGKEDGVVRWVAAKGRGVFDDDGRCLRVVGTAIDVSRRKSGEVALAASELRLRELNERLEIEVAERTAERDRIWRLSRDLMCVATADGILVSVNPAWERVLGWSPEWLAGRNAAEIKHVDDAQRTADELEHLAAGLSTLGFEDRYRDKKGEWHWFSWTIQPEGELIYCIGRDVTEDRRRREELEQTQEALRQSQKMEAVGQLTGGIAHDFNNMLQGVSGSLDLIRRKPEDAGRVERWAAAGLEAAERGAKLTGQLLAFSRSQRLDTKPLQADRLIARMVDLLDRTLGPTVETSLELLSEDAFVLGDETQLEMAVLNLAINARDAMPEGGVITIRTAPYRSDRDTDLKAGDYVEVNVADNGTGMTPEVLARALDPFFTTKGVGKGTGLGLSQVYGMARQAGGTLRLASAVGSGTSIRLFMPRCEPPTDSVPVAAETIDDEQPAAHVLIVDDDAVVRRFLADALEALEYRATLAEDGPSGLAAFERERPDVVVLDFAMPGMNGAEVAKELRSRQPHLPIVFASGYSDTAALEAAIGNDATFLRKPFRTDELQRALTSALRET